MSDLVVCETHGWTKAHAETPECLWPHYWIPDGPLPSMSAVETLDPREAVCN